jgi:hypothetical protein
MRVNIRFRVDKVKDSRDQEMAGAPWLLFTPTHHMVSAHLIPYAQTEGARMKTLHYRTTISAGKQRVWQTMLDPVQYRKWAAAFSSDSQFEGEWREGSHMNFFDPAMGGTRALLEEVKPYDLIRARHIALLEKDGTEDTESETAKKWIGAVEIYSFKEENGVTELSIEMKTPEDFVEMFNEGWPKAFQVLKDLCE